MGTPKPNLPYNNSMSFHGPERAPNKTRNSAPSPHKPSSPPDASGKLAKEAPPSPSKDNYSSPTSDKIGIIFQNRKVSEDLGFKISGRRLTDLFYHGKIKVLWEQLSPELKEFFKTPEGMKDFYRRFFNKMGPEKRIVSEEILQDAGNTTYNRRIQGKKEYIIRWTWDTTGTITEFKVLLKPELAPSRFLKYQTKTALKLPFRGPWFVYWGGRDLETNRHAAVRNQRFAFDFHVEVEGKSFRGEGKTNEDYYSFGKEILAPGAGTIIEAQNNVPENIPGHTNYDNLLGNHVIIDHHNGEYSFFAHFKQGTLQVKVGDEVQVGDLLAQCGNSGNTSEPHLHYHLQNSPRFEDGEGLPVRFMDYLANGELVKSGEPFKGQVVQRR